MVDDISYQLGEIKGLLHGINNNVAQLSDKVDGMDDRLRHVEKKAAINGAVSGGIISATVAGVIAVVKANTGGA
ncbi:MULTISPECIES: hypothetical protein [Thalassospira]|uniref:Uncharacterized protein n=1 Tax=Thalassospira marina TaxID=2048283 RepID=A0A2N3KY42_9PROT|nr:MULTISPECIES: hypothetical protein [Thalassospira]OSQ41660.1 hypothetical protein THS27_18265 [Thalassospira sp. MCCC 1A01428]PKR55492.1 hypothetical protein COO20_04800 [Thalassospira marina]